MGPTPAPAPVSAQAQGLQPLVRGQGPAQALQRPQLAKEPVLEPQEPQEPLVLRVPVPGQTESLAPQSHWKWPSPRFRGQRHRRHRRRRPARRAPGRSATSATNLSSYG